MLLRNESSYCAPKVNIGGLTAAAVLAALYNASKPQGYGFLQYNAASLTEDDAAKLLNPDRQRTYFDYLIGRVMKVEIPHTVAADTEIDVRLYDRDNGEGAAARVIESLRASKNVVTPEIEALHRRGLVDAAEAVLEDAKHPTTTEIRNGIAVTTLRADPEIVGPAVEKALKARADTLR